MLTGENKSSGSIGRSIPLFLWIFLLTGSLFSLGIFKFYQSEIDIRTDTLKKQEIFSLELQTNHIEDITDAVIGDLLYLSQQNELQEYFKSNSEDTLEKMAVEYVAAAQQKKIYDQIRFIDTHGVEAVRVNYNSGEVSKVPQEKLQSKKNRYYFKKTYKLDKGEVYISPFDLNIENGVIEQPLKPMIRFGTPVFDSNNQKRGIVIVNYLAQTLLEKILDVESISEGQTMLLNSDGYWLLSPDSNQAWGFMFGKKEQVFGKLYPEVWKVINKIENGQFRSSKGIFTFKTIYPLSHLSYIRHSGKGVAEKSGAEKSGADFEYKQYRWHLVSFFPSAGLSVYIKHLQLRVLIVLATILFLLAMAAWLIAFFYYPKKNVLRQDGRVGTI